MIHDERQDLLTYDYAVGGDRVENLEQQVGRGFETIRRKPDWAPWLMGDSLFGKTEAMVRVLQLMSFLAVTWIGINDCACVSHFIPTRAALKTVFRYIGAGIGSEKSSIAALFSYQERLYAAGARNFMFIDVPPMHMSPSCKHRVLLLSAH